MSAAPTWVTLASRDSNTANIKTAMLEDRKAGSFTDVVIACRDRKTVRVHKLLLVATSSFLANILSNIENYEESAVLILPDFESAIIKRLVSALYGDGAGQPDGDWSLEEARKTLGLNTSNETGNQVICKETLF